MLTRPLLSPVDLDSLCSAVVFAYLRSHTQPKNTLHIPLANIPREDLSLRPELTKALSYAGVGSEDLLTLSDLDEVVKAHHEVASRVVKASHPLASQMFKHKRRISMEFSAFCLSWRILLDHDCFCMSQYAVTKDDLGCLTTGGLGPSS